MGSDDVVARVTGFLSNVPNAFYYSILRREMVERILAFTRTMPIFLSFHDQIICLLYLLCGKFIQLPRLLYAYDVGVWQFFETAQKRDIDFYKAAGLDPAVNKLHWLLCGFGGAVLIGNSALFPDYPLDQRQLMADRWFSLNFLRFRGQDRAIGESRFVGDAQKLRAKLETSMGQLSFQDMLTEICGLFALFAQGKAHAIMTFGMRRSTVVQPPRPTSMLPLQAGRSERASWHRPNVELAFTLASTEPPLCERVLLKSFHSNGAASSMSSTHVRVGYPHFPHSEWQARSPRNIINLRSLNSLPFQISVKEA